MSELSDFNAEWDASMRRISERQAERERARAKEEARRRKLKIILFPFYFILMVLAAIVYVSMFAGVDLLILLIQTYHPCRFGPDYMWPCFFPWLGKDD